MPRSGADMDARLWSLPDTRAAAAPGAPRRRHPAVRTPRARNSRHARWQCPHASSESLAVSTPEAWCQAARGGGPKWPLESLATARLEACLGPASCRLGSRRCVPNAEPASRLGS